jgi:tetratricopeptide (TPR) repeat protein
LLRQGDLRGARAALEKARDRDPTSVLLRVDLATVYRNLGDLPRARAEAEEAVRLDPKAPQAHVEKGLVLGALGKEGEAGQELRRALDMSPDHADALFYLAAIALRADHPERALPLLERLARVAPRYPGGREALAAAHRAAAATGETTATPEATVTREARATPRAPGTPRTAGPLHLRLLRVRDRDRAEEAARRARAGESFEDLVRALSEDPSAARGGDLGEVQAADLAEPLRSAAATLAVGGLSPVLETANGYVLLRREK